MEKELKAAILRLLSEYKKETSPQALSRFASTPAKDLFLCHFGLGLYIRNNYLRPESELYNLFAAEGVTQMDDMSSTMIRIWHISLQD